MALLSTVSHSNMDGNERDALIHKHIDLVRYEVDRLAVGLPREVDREDLISAGIIGLIKAVDRFDPERGASFSTYATTVMRGAILDELRGMDWAPRGLRGRYRRLEEAIATLRQRLSRQPDEDEIAAELGVSNEEYRRLLSDATATAIVSLEALMETSGDARTPSTDHAAGHRPEWNPAAAVDEAEGRRLLVETIGELSEREQLIISLYYYEELTMQEIGVTVGVTESRICQIHTQAIARLRAGLFARLGK